MQAPPSGREKRIILNPLVENIWKKFMADQKTYSYSEIFFKLFNFEPYGEGHTI